MLKITSTLKREHLHSDLTDRVNTRLNKCDSIVCRYTALIWNAYLAKCNKETKKSASPQETKSKHNTSLPPRRAEKLGMRLKINLLCSCWRCFGNNSEVKALDFELVLCTEDLQLICSHCRLLLYMASEDLKINSLLHYNEMVTIENVWQ